MAAAQTARWAKIKGKADSKPREEGQEALECGWKGGHYCRHEGQAGQGERHDGNTQGCQKEGSPQQPGGEGQTRSGCPRQMGQGQSGGGRPDCKVWNVGRCNADASRRTRKTVHFRQDARTSVPALGCGRPLRGCRLRKGETGSMRWMQHGPRRHPT